MTTVMHRNENERRLLDRDEENALVRRSKRGDVRARNRIIDAYRPLCESMARMQAERISKELQDDLYSEAVLAFIDVLDNRYDPENERGARIGSYARHYIHAALCRYVRDNITVTRLATNTGDKRVFHGYQRARAKWEQENGRPIDDEGRDEIARRMRVDPRIVDRMSPRIDNRDVSIDHDTEIRPQAHGESRTVYGENPERDASARVDGLRVGNALHEALDQLPPIERRILEARHLAEEKGKLLRDIAAEEEITSKQAKQREINGLGRLRREMEERGYGIESCL